MEKRQLRALKRQMAVPGQTSESCGMVKRLYIFHAEWAHDADHPGAIQEAAGLDPDAVWNLPYQAGVPMLFTDE